ncbi:MAG: fimbrial protein [Rhizobiaceae bacterium]
MAGQANDDEKPLDPAVERVRRRLIRFMVINLGILFVAFAVVLGAIIYKLSFAPKKAAEQARAVQVPNGNEPITATIPLPAGARLLSSSLSGSRALLTVELTDKSQTLIFYDLEAGRIIGSYALKPAAQ